MLLYLHPLFQLACLGLGLAALIVAWPRFVTLHLGRKTIFRRPRHLLLGQMALWGMLAGLAGGLLIARLQWKTWLVTGAHAWGGLAMLPLIAFGLLSGLYLARRPRQRKALPLAHGINNLLVILMTFFQAHTGRQVIEDLIAAP